MREIVLGLRAPSAASKKCKRPCANPEAAKKRRCIKEVEVGPSVLGASDLGFDAAASCQGLSKDFFLCL